MTLSPKEQGSTIQQDIKTGREILAYAEQDPKFKHSLAGRLDQYSVISMGAFLMSRRDEWTKQGDMNRALIWAGIHRANLFIHSGSMFYKYEAAGYTEAERLAIDPPSPTDTQPGAE